MNISLKNVEYYYPNLDNTRKGISDISLELHSPVRIAVIGQTGSGKSTLLKLIKGLLPLQKGEFLMDFSQAEIGYLFQYPEHQIFEPNIYKEISYGARKRKWKEEVILEKAKEVLTLVGLDQTYLSRSSFHLSGGEKRRIALASVLITDPELLILDEATVGLDSKGKKQLFEIILKWQKKNKRSLLFITHHMDDVLDYAEEVLVMKEGKILSHTTPSLLFQQHSSSLENLGLVLPTRVQFLNQLNQKLSEKLEIHGNLTEENILAVLEEKSQNKGKKE